MANQAVINQLNKRLNAIFDTEDEFYKILVAGGTPHENPDSLAEPFIDLNQGAIANVIQYNRNLTDSMLEQTNLNQAEGDLLDYLGAYLYNIYRDYQENEAGEYTLEEDDVYKERIKDRIFGTKESPLSILRAISDQQSEDFPLFFYKEGDEQKINKLGYPFIKEAEEVLALSAFANHSYAGVYQNLEVNDKQILPAICGSGDFNGIERFYFRVYMMLDKPEILKTYEQALADYEKGIITEKPEKTSEILQKEAQFKEKQQRIAAKISYMKAAGVDFQLFFLEEDLFARNSFNLDVELSTEFSSEAPFNLDLTFSAFTQTGFSLKEYIINFKREEETEISTLKLAVLEEEGVFTLDESNLILEDHLNLFSDNPLITAAVVSEETEAFMLSLVCNEAEREETLKISAKAIFQKS